MEEKPKKKFYKRWWFWLIVVLVVLFLIGSSSPTPKENSSPVQTQTKTQPEVKVPAIKLSAQTLLQAYKDNEVNGDTLYKGKLVEVSGTIETIGKDILDDPYITFKNIDPYAVDNVQCMFNKTDEGILAQLKKGETITIQGTVSGMTIGNVVISDCVKI